MKKIWVFFLLSVLFVSSVKVFSVSTDFDIRLVFQNPSYLLEKNEVTNIFHCDRSLGDCKVNYNLEINEGGGYKNIPTKYMCEWDFWFWETTGEEWKCNPNTISYPLWEFTTRFQVILKSDPNISYSNEIYIRNGESQSLQDDTEENSEDEFEEVIKDEEEEENLPEILPEEDEEAQEENQEDVWESPETENTELWDVLEENTQFWEILEEEVINEEIQSGMGIIFSYPVKLLFQSPTYFLESMDESGDMFHCDSSKTDCKANFNLNIDEGNGWKTLGTKYICEWDFWFWEITGEEWKCNPNTITYPIWDFTTIYTVKEKTNTGIFITHSFWVKNTWFQEPQTQKVVYVGNSTSSSSSLSLLEIKTPEIIIQSGLDENNVCKNTNCKINLNYIPQSSQEACLWDFPGGSFDIQTREKCNPGYVNYPEGDFIVTLKVYEKSNPYNFKQSYLYFSNKSLSSTAHILIDSEWKNVNEELEEKEEKMNTQEILKNYTVKISKVFPNPVGVDHLEFIEIENYGNEPLNLFWCSLDDIIPGGSKPYFIEKDVILLPQEKRKFYKYDTKININNSGKEQANILCHGVVIDSLTWEFSTPEWFFITKGEKLSEIQSVKKQKNSDFFEILYFSWERKKVSFDEKLEMIQDILTQNIPKLQKREKLFELSEKTFSQKILKQKSWIKISGTTLPQTKIILELSKIDEDEFTFSSFIFGRVFASKNFYETTSDKQGNYEIILQEVDVWEFQVKTLLAFTPEDIYEMPKVSTLEVDEEYLLYINTQTNTPSEKETSFISPKAIITLQWKLSHNKTFFNNKLTCHNVDECSVNLDGSQSEGKKLSYFWDFGNGKTFDKKNPASYKFTTGTYFISLTVSDEMQSDTTYFVVEIPWKIQKETQKTQEIENKTTKNNKIDIIPTVYASSEPDNNILLHIYMSVLIFIVFIVGSVVLLKRQKII